MLDSRRNFIPDWSSDRSIERSNIDSGDCVARREFGRPPCLALENAAQRLHGIPDIDEACVKRRKAEAQNGWLSIVADHAARDQRLHHFVAVRMFEAHVR